MLTTLTLFCEGQGSWVHDVCQCKEPLVPLSSVDKHCLTKNSVRACGMGLELMAPEPADLCSVSGNHRKIGENQSFTSCLWLPRVCPRGMHHQEINVKRIFFFKKRFLWKQMIKMTRAKLLNFYKIFHSQVQCWWLDHCSTAVSWVSQTVPRHFVLFMFSKRWQSAFPFLDTEKLHKMLSE